MASSLEFLSGRGLSIVDTFLEVQKKLFARHEAMSSWQVYDRFVQPLFCYGMEFSNDRESVMEVLLRLFIQIDRGRFYAARPVQVFLFREFRKKLRQPSGSGWPHKEQTFKPCTHQGVGCPTPLHQEALFLKLKCGFKNGEVAAIMGVRSKVVSRWLDESLEYFNRHTFSVKKKVKRPL
ncbi:hypothetical protein [Chryseolinea lacunae]|uniref:Sigma-70 family RNA polymerase sigma factor n=1 Tax=Chryseolinea lacunae TaxID=2801331 RepID=A0ABS1KYV8_9BACT|nr:hypothetical protein [Chryseolinea lacunae]MBL0744640.1 hypothetical protein [Chryseolinea lacunae]